MTNKIVAMPLEKAAARATRQAKSNPDFEKLVTHLLFKSLLDAVKNGELSCNGADGISIEKNNKNSYISRGWYHTDFAKVMGEKCDLAPAELMSIIDKYMFENQSQHAVLKKWQLSDEGELYLWERKDYMMFHLTLMKRRIR